MGVRRASNIRQALQYVAANPELTTDDIVNLPVHELVCRTLFEIANAANLSSPASLVRANRARQLIFDRMVGRRLPGSHPATSKKANLEFHDLTGKIGR